MINGALASGGFNAVSNMEPDSPVQVLGTSGEPLVSAPHCKKPVPSHSDGRSSRHRYFANVSDLRSGVGLLFQLVPGMVKIMLLAGALYIAWIGVSLVRSQPGEAGQDLPQTAVRPSWATFRRAMLTCLLNPKAYLFMLAIFPQFLRVEYGPVWIQAVALGLIIAVTQIGVYGGLALAAGSASGWLAAKPGAGQVLARGVGALLILGAAVTALGAFQSAGGA